MSKPTNQYPSDDLPEGSECVANGGDWFAVGGVLLIALLALLAYWPALNGGFIWDDHELLLDNQLVHAPDGLYRMWCTNEAIDYWPMTYTTFWFEWRLWGMYPSGYHVVNLLLHVVAALLIWKILKKLAIPGAFLAALLFAVHPVNVESVAWIAQRKNTLSIVFFLLSIVWYLRGEEGRSREGRGATDEGRAGVGTQKDTGLRRWGWYGLSLLAFVAAMLSKGSVAILPVALLLIVWWQRRRVSAGDVLRTVPFFAVAVILTLVNIWFQTHGTHAVIRSADFAQRLAEAGATVWFYLSKAILPIDLIFVYPQWHIETGDLLWWLPLLTAAVVTVLLWLHRNAKQAIWGPGLFFAWAFFCVALAPVLGFADVYFMKYSLVADHYQYIALVAVAALAAAGWNTWRQTSQRQAAMAAAVIVIGALTFLTWRQSHDYKDMATLYEATLRRNPDCWMAHNNLGLELVKMDQPQAAIEHYLKALRIKPDYPEAHNNLGILLRDSGQVPEAIDHFEQAIRLDPKYVDARVNLGIALVKANKMQEAVAEFKQAVGLRPDYAEARNDLANVLLDTGQTEEAIEQYRIALRLRPDYAVAHVNLGNALREHGRLEEAIDQYRQALQLRPDDSATYANLTRIYAALNRSAEAIATAQQALNVARSQGQSAQAEQIAAWLTKYRSQLEQSEKSSPSGAGPSSP